MVPRAVVLVSLALTITIAGCGGRKAYCDLEVFERDPATGVCRLVPACPQPGEDPKGAIIPCPTTNACGSLTADECLAADGCVAVFAGRPNAAAFDHCGDDPRTLVLRD